MPLHHLVNAFCLSPTADCFPPLVVPLLLLLLPPVVLPLLTTPVTLPYPKVGAVGGGRGILVQVGGPSRRSLSEAAVSDEIAPRHRWLTARPQAGNFGHYG